MTPLARLILHAMRIGALVCAACVALFLAIAVWQNWLAAAPRDLAYRDYAFMAVLAILLAGCLWLARAITRELRNN